MELRGIITGVVVLGLGLTLAGCAKTPPTAATSPTTIATSPTTTTPPMSPAGSPTGTAGTTATDTAAPGETTTCAYTVTTGAARPVTPPPTDNVPAAGTVTAAVTLNQGDVAITMDRSKTPCTINSFLSLAQQGFYDNTPCHRLVDRGIFVLQCGDPTGTGSGGPGYKYPDETYDNDTYPAGTVAMANAGPNTNGSQFFFVYQDSPLPPSYTVFGHMDAASLAVIANVAAAGEDGANGTGDGHPNNPATILSIAVG